MTKDADNLIQVLRLQCVHKHLTPCRSSRQEQISSKWEKNMLFMPTTEAHELLLICQEKGKITDKRTLFFLTSSLSS